MTYLGFAQLDVLDGLGKVVRPAIRHVIPIDTGQDDVADAPPGHRLGRLKWLKRVGGRRRAGGLDGAELAATVGERWVGGWVGWGVGVGGWANWTYRVHVSPSSMMVPVPPFQHSPMLGHCASSQTVCRSSSLWCGV